MSKPGESDNSSEKLSFLRQRIEKKYARHNSPDIDTDEYKKKILHERAAALAVSPEEEKSDNSLQLLTFVLDNEHYGIDVRYVVETSKIDTLCRIPGIPAHFAGLTSIRGEIVPIIDIQEFFGVPHTLAEPLEDILLVEVNTIKAAIVVDKVLDIMECSLDDISPPLSTFDKAMKEFIRGEVSCEGSMIIFLDGEKIMTDARMFVMQEV